MPEHPDINHGSPLDEILAEYMLRVDRDEPVDREAFVAQHPEFADQLRQYFADVDAVDNMVGSAAEGDLFSRIDKLGPPPLQGIRSLGDYELLEEIARGGMGVVYKARQLSLQRIVAVKMILGGRLAGPADIDRFHREARTAANLKHPGIVPVFEVGEHDGEHFISMGYIESKSLAVLARESPLECKRAAEYLKQAAEAVHYAHQQGTLHRDLKPSNILVDNNGTTHITDFGLAKRIEEDSRLTTSKAAVGSPAYMPPEQASGKHDLIGPASDIYSLGATLYDLLTGRPPFYAQTPAATLSMVLGEEPVSPCTINSTIDGDLETICLKCLDKDCHKRYADAQMLADDLGRYLAGEPIHARPTGRIERLWRWCKRKPALATLACSLGMLLLLLAVADPLVALKQTALRRAEEEAKHDAQMQTHVAMEARIRETQQKRKAEKHLYLNRVAWAEKLWFGNEVNKAETMLDACPPDLHDWEWGYLKRLCHSELLTLRGHNAAVSSVVFSPDGKRLASGGWDNTVKIWNADTGQEVRTLRGHKGFVTCVAFTPDGKSIVWGSEDSSIRISDAETGEQVHVYRGHFDNVSSVAINLDGTRLASASRDGTIRLWNTATEQGVCEIGGPKSRISCFAFFDDRTTLISYVEREHPWIVFWDMTSGKRRDEQELAGVTAQPIAFGHNGKPLIMYPPLHAWTTGTKEIQWLEGLDPDDNLAVLSPNGQRLVAGTATGTFAVWNCDTGERLCRVNLEGFPIRCFAFDNKGDRIAAGSAEGRVLIADAASGKEQLALIVRTADESPVNLTSVAFSPD